MFRKPVRRYKWALLVPFDGERSALSFVEVIDRSQKRYFFEALPSGLNMPFAVSVAYAQSSWRGQAQRCQKSKADLLIVRPHLRREWLMPLDACAIRQKDELEQFACRLDQDFCLFEEEAQSDGKLSRTVGIELTLSANDIRKHPEKAAIEWRKAASLFEPQLLGEPVIRMKA